MLKKIILFICLVLLLCGVVYCGFKSLKKPVKKVLISNQQSVDYQGIDVSNHQGKIDWEKVASDKNIQFVYIKVTEGATHVDKSYAHNIKEARKNGLKAGSYHYLRNTSTIRDQFQNFKNVAKKEYQDLIPMVDVEEKVEKDSIRLFCDLLEEYMEKDRLFMERINLIIIIVLQISTTMC